MVRLSLDQCLHMALEGNLTLVSARFVPEISEQDVLVEQSNYDFNFEARYRRSESESPATQLSTVTGSKRDNFSTGIQQLTKFGATYSAGWFFNKGLQTGPNVTAPTSYFSGLSLDLTLPILKGFGTTTTTETLVLARNDLDISRSDLEGQAETILEQVEGAYWDVVAAREALRTQRLALQRAEDLLELNRKKVEVGTLAPIEITQAEAGVASEVENGIIAETNLGNAEDELRRLLAVPSGDPMWGKGIYNTTAPSYHERKVDLGEAIDTALMKRPEMVSARQTVRNRELNERVSRREVRPQLDFNVNYTPQGASVDIPEITDPGTGAIIIPAEQAVAGDAISNIGNGETYSWFAEALFRVPIGNRRYKAQYARARLSREQAQVDLSDQEQTIRVEVRRAVRDVEQGIKRVDAAVKNVELQQKKLDAEQKKFENGMSTSFEVLSFQKDLADAELSEIRAKLNYIKSLAALERSKGTLLEKYGLSISMDE